MAGEQSPQDDLVGQAVGGDASAQERLFSDCHQRLEEIIKRELPGDMRGKLGVEDIVQETFLEAFKTIGRFKNTGPGSFEAWLTTIARHRLVDAIRRRRGRGRQKKPKSMQPASDSVADPLGHGKPFTHTPSRSAMRREWALVLGAAIDSLPDEDERRVLRLKYFSEEELSWDDIAARVGRESKAAARALCHRAIKRLRDALQSVSHFMSRS